MELLTIGSQQYDLGRCALFGIAGGWDETVDLFGATMIHYGTTDGPVDIAANPEYSDLKIESTGPAILKRYLSGENPSFELGVYPNPDNLGVFTPTARGSAGQARRRAVREHTLWLVPEELFLKADADGNQTQVVLATADGGLTWTKDGGALSVNDQRLLDSSLVIWRAHFDRLTPRFAHEDGGKSLKNIPVTVLQDLDKPDGCQLYLVLGELTDFATLSLLADES